MSIIFIYVYRLKLTTNVWRVGDVALCCPDGSGRQGNIAYTLLPAGY